MTNSPWRYSSEGPKTEASTICLETENWAGLINVLQPDEGLGQLTNNRQPVSANRLLAAQLEYEESDSALNECYIRGDDLIAVYQDTGKNLVRAQVYWRVLPSFPCGPGGLGLELIASVQTDLLHSEPRLLVKSEFSDGEVWRMVENGDDELIRLDCTLGQNLEYAQDTGLGGFVVRGVHPQFDYLQAIHPSDSHRTWISRRNGGVAIIHELFPESLEKGVIRRGRVRGWFISRADDAAMAAACYRAWLSEPPPLTT